jgi:hypothetical protein
MTDDELRSLFDAMRQENAAAHGETRQANAAEIAALRKENVAAHAETRQMFEETTTRITAENRHQLELALEGFRGQVELIAEKVVGVTEELHRESADIRREIRAGFAETQAMIKFSHSELDRRVTSLESAQRTTEETLADVQTRLERLESSTH